MESTLVPTFLTTQLLPPKLISISTQLPQEFEKAHIEFRRILREKLLAEVRELASAFTNYEKAVNVLKDVVCEIARSFPQLKMMYMDDTLLSKVLACEMSQLAILEDTSLVRLLELPLDKLYDEPDTASSISDMFMEMRNNRHLLLALYETVGVQGALTHSAFPRIVSGLVPLEHVALVLAEELALNGDKLTEPYRKYLLDLLIVTASVYVEKSNKLTEEIE